MYLTKGTKLHWNICCCRGEYKCYKMGHDHYCVFHKIYFSKKLRAYAHAFLLGIYNSDPEAFFHGTNLEGPSGHCSQKGPYFRDRVPIGPIFDFLGPYSVPIYISGSLFSVFWLKSRKKCKFSLHVHINE